MIRNAPLLHDGTPMPTRYWLVDPELSKQVARLESAGGVRAAEAAVDPEELRATHDRYARERDAVLPRGHRGPRPSRRRRRYPPRREVSPRALRPLPRRRRRSGRPLGRGAPAVTRVASVDIGTNSTRLLVADVDGTGRDAKLLPLERHTQITRLGQGVDRDRDVASRRDRAHRRRAAPVPPRHRRARRSRRCGRPRPAHRATRRTATTSSGRPSRCSASVRSCSRARTRPGSNSSAPPPVSPNRGRTSSSTSAAARPSSSRAATSPKGSCSIDIGCVRLTEQFLHGDPPDTRGAEPGRLGRARSSRRRRPSGAGRGTGEDAGRHRRHGVDARRDRARRGSEPRAIGSTSSASRGPPPRRCSGCSRPSRSPQRRQNPGLEPGRVDVIVGGAIVVVGVMRHWGFDELLVSEADILDGLARTMA